MGIGRDFVKQVADDAIRQVNSPLNMGTALPGKTDALGIVQEGVVTAQSAADLKSYTLINAGGTFLSAGNLVPMVKLDTKTFVTVVGPRRILSDDPPSTAAYVLLRENGVTPHKYYVQKLGDETLYEVVNLTIPTGTGGPNDYGWVGFSADGKAIVAYRNGRDNAVSGMSVSKLTYCNNFILRSSSEEIDGTFGSVDVDIDIAAARTFLESSTAGFPGVGYPPANSQNFNGSNRFIGKSNFNGSNTLTVDFTYFKQPPGENEYYLYHAYIRPLLGSSYTFATDGEAVPYSLIRGNAYVNAVDFDSAVDTFIRMSPFRSKSGTQATTVHDRLPTATTGPNSFINRNFSPSMITQQSFMSRFYFDPASAVNWEVVTPNTDQYLFRSDFLEVFIDNGFGYDTLGLANNRPLVKPVDSNKFLSIKCVEELPGIRYRTTISTFKFNGSGTLIKSGKSISGRTEDLCSGNPDYTIIDFVIRE